MTKRVEVATLPPAYLYEREYVPSVPESVPPRERTEYFLDAYAARGDALERSNRRFGLIEQWVEYIKELYPETKVVEEHSRPEPPELEVD